MRKLHEERRDEILDVSERMFLTEGYDRTSVADLIEAVGIAKGTFYYYFASKEEVMDAVVRRFIDREGARLQAIADLPAKTALQKLELLFAASRPDRDHVEKVEMLDRIHHTDAELHMKSISLSIRKIVPILESVLLQGNAEGVFRVERTHVTAELAVAGIQFLFNDGFFPDDEEKNYDRLCDFVDLLEELFHARKGALGFVKRLFGEETI